jgi:hypothetical protein
LLLRALGAGAKWQQGQPHQRPWLGALPLWLGLLLLLLLLL